MQHTSADLLRQLGGGTSIDALCASKNWSRAEFDEWWRGETSRRAPQCEGVAVAAVDDEVEIRRDRFGVPHIAARQVGDLWYGFGYAMAQDRLFQLDYLRRKGHGRLAEILGAEALPLDLIARTVGLNRIARAELQRLSGETRRLLEAFSAGVNGWIEHCCDALPIEFDLLGYHPEPWSPIDCLAIENEFRWYLTGRFPVIVMPELAKRVLGEGVLYRELLLGEADDEAIVPPEAYAELRRDLAGDVWSQVASRPREPLGQASGDPEGTGSNNWVVAGRHCQSGQPMVAGDPHIAFEAVSCWYAVHLCGGGFNVAGMAYVGMPAILYGRNERVAWAITNNICSQRDLYQERTDPTHPNCFAFGDGWEPARELTEVIRVRGSEPISRTIRFSRNGPIVDEILPPPAPATGPVSLKWLGAYHGGWLTALLGINRAASLAEFREALRPWHVPTFNLAAADDAGHIALQTTGRLPLRKLPERGYRPGWDPDHQWCGLLPFEAMPHAIDPPRGWLVSANNRLAADDYPYPLYGTWISGYRARRIRQMLEGRLTEAAGGLTLNDFRGMQLDSLSLRAKDCVPPLLAALAGDDAPRVRAAAKILEHWDGRVEPEEVAATLFDVFFTFWCQAVAEARFEGETAELLTRQVEGLADRLLSGDPHGWFPPGECAAAVQRVFQRTLDYLTERWGPRMENWQWGRLHQLPLKHVLGSRGDLGQLLNHGGGGVRGDMVTVCNTGSGPDWLATTGATSRIVADLSTNGLWLVDAQSQSGNPGTRHYRDQLSTWSAGEYHFLPLDPDDVAKITAQRLVLRGST